MSELEAESEDRVGLRGVNGVEGGSTGVEEESTEVEGGGTSGRPEGIQEGEGRSRGVDRGACEA